MKVDMAYTVRPRNGGHGSRSILESEAREALRAARQMMADGIEDIEIVDEDGTTYDLEEFERITGDGEGP
jgi:hypothetical protein